MRLRKLTKLVNDLLGIVGIHLGANPSVSIMKELYDFSKGKRGRVVGNCIYCKGNGATDEGEVWAPCPDCGGTGKQTGYKTLDLVTYPHPALTESCLFIEEDEFGKEIDKLAFSMEMIMNDYDGAGLSAPQVGINRRLFVVKEGLMDHVIICNPIWDSLPGATKYIDWEGCLSFPNIMLPITRYNKILVSYQDWAGNTHTNRLEGFAARVFQHESDHLHGVLFTSRIEDDELRKRILHAG